MANYFIIPPNEAGQFIYQVGNVIVEPREHHTGDYILNLQHRHLFSDALKAVLDTYEQRVILATDIEADGSYVLVPVNELTGSMLNARVPSVARNLKSNDNSEIIFKYSTINPLLFWGRQTFNRASLHTFLASNANWSISYIRMGGV